MRVCARVLAAALMSGAIAAALAFPARFGPGDEHGRALTAPPSSQQLTLYMPAVPAPRPQAAQIVVHHLVENAPRAASSLAAVRQVSAPRSRAPRSRAPGSRPQATVTRDLAAVTPAPVAPPPAAAAPAPERRHGRGHAYGHDKQHGKPKQPVPATETPTSVAAASAPAQTMEGPDDVGGRGNGKGHAYGHDKERPVGG